MTAPLLGQAIPLHRTEGNRRIEKILRELGPDIRALLDDRAVIEIMLNANGLLWVERLGEGLAALGAFPTTQAEALIYSLGVTACN